MPKNQIINEMLGEEIMIIDYSTTIKSSGFPDAFIISAIYDSVVKIKLKQKKITVKLFFIFIINDSVLFIRIPIFRLNIEQEYICKISESAFVVYELGIRRMKGSGNILRKSYKQRVIPLSN